MQFNEDYASSIVPLGRVEKNEDLREGDACFVQWSNRKRYDATLICSGNVQAVC